MSPSWKDTPSPALLVLSSYIEIDVVWGGQRRSSKSDAYLQYDMQSCEDTSLLFVSVLTSDI